MTDPAYLAATRDTYDRVAADYAALLAGSLAERPLERAVLTAFAEYAGPVGPVADLGCGPGRITGFLRDCGLDVCGVDLSPGMVEVARRTCPDVEFEVGIMSHLAFPDGSLGGVLGWYGFVHSPPAELPVIFAEFHRVLRPGGVALLGFHVGDQVRQLTSAYGHDVDLVTYWRQPAELSATLAAAGLATVATMVVEPQGSEKCPQGFLLAHKEPRTISA